MEMRCEIGPTELMVRTVDQNTLYFQSDKGGGSLIIPRAGKVLEAMAEPIIVTRHPALQELLRSQFPTSIALEAASARQLRGRVCIGILPMHLMAEPILFVRTHVFDESDRFAARQRRRVELTADEVLRYWSGITIHTAQTVCLR